MKKLELMQDKLFNLLAFGKESLWIIKFGQLYKIRYIIPSRSRLLCNLFKLFICVVCQIKIKPVRAFQYMHHHQIHESCGPGMVNSFVQAALRKKKPWRGKHLLEVERVLYASHPDLRRLEKAKKMLK